MTDLVYRFRSIENLLGEFQELERQQIFFASREQLNDPMEGYKRFFWLGDRVLWENLFRHYIQGLFYACSMMAVANNEHPIGWSHVPFRSPSNDAPTSIMFSHLDELTEHFFAHEAVQVLIRMIGGATTTCTGK